LPEGPLSIILTNVTDGYVLNSTLAATFPPESSTSWYNITNWRYLFGLTNGKVTVAGQNVNRIRLLVLTGSTTRMVEETGTGNIQREMLMDILPEASYDYRVLYEVHDMKAPVTLTIIQQGTKMGADDSVSTLHIFGVQEGNLTVEARVNGALLGTGRIRVGAFAPVTTAIPEITPGTLSPAPTTLPETSSATNLPTTLPEIAPVTTPPSTPIPSGQSPSPVSTPVPGPDGFSLGIIGYAAVIIAIAIVADYFLLKD
jgi:hypothetical protein